MTAWLPGVYTRPLQEPMVSDGPKVREFIRLFWKTDDGQPFVLDEWQSWLIDSVLERYPDDWHDESLRGRLRYRQCLVSMGRQNGKSVLGAVLGMYGLLMHQPGPYVVGLASNADQATIIYNRVKFVIDNNAHLSKMFKATGTRGISRLDKPGTYKVKPAKGDAIQGIPVTFCLYDEVHITAPEMWSGVVLGTSAQPDGMVLGITTAGDDNSELLKDLYGIGRKAAAGDSDLERFGFFLWEAPTGDLTVENVIAANPALASGRLDEEVIMGQVLTLPENEARRYRLNRFVGSEHGWMPAHLFAKVLTDEPMDVTGNLVFTIDVEPNWERASVVVSRRESDGTVRAELIAEFTDPVKPSRKNLIGLCEDLAAAHPTATFVLNNRGQGDVIADLMNKGLNVYALKAFDITNAASSAYSLIARQQVKVTRHGTLTTQMPFAVAKFTDGGETKIVRSSTSVHIDAVCALAFAIHVTEKQEEMVPQIF